MNVKESAVKLVETYHLNKTGESLAILMRTFQDAITAYEEVIKVIENENAHEVAKEDRYAEFESRVLNAKAAIQYYENIVFLRPFIEEMNRNTNKNTEIQ